MYVQGGYVKEDYVQGGSQLRASRPKGITFLLSTTRKPPEGGWVGGGGRG